MNRTADQPEPNPLREGLSARPVPQPCSIVIFGATGDLTHRKLVPALYNLAADGELPPGVVIVGFARRDKSDDEFRRDLEEFTRKLWRRPVRDATKGTTNAGVTSKNPHASFRVSLCATKSGTRLRNLFFIIRASLVMKLVISGWPNVSRSSTRAMARAPTVSFTWQPGLTSSNQFSRT